MNDRITKFITDFVFEWEVVRDKKGNVIAEHDKDDPGGTTKYGIDQRSHPDVDVENLTRDKAISIYLIEYAADGCILLPQPFDLVFFDTAINCGLSRARRWTQTAAGTKVDGVIGPKSVAAINSTSTPALISTTLRLREEHYRNLSKSGNFSKYLAGWLNRVEALKKYIAKPI